MSDSLTIIWPRCRAGAHRWLRGRRGQAPHLSLPPGRSTAIGAGLARVFQLDCYEIWLIEKPLSIDGCRLVHYQDDTPDRATE